MNDATAPLPALTAIDVTGTDTESFLQGQLSADIAALGTAEVGLGAWINPAGRVIAMVDLVRIDDGVRLFVPGSMAAAFAERLQRFVFRSKVSLEIRRDVLAGVSSVQSDESFARHSPSRAIESFAFGDAPTTLPASDVDAHIAARTAAGIAWIGPASSERFTAHQLNLDLLGAVSLTKGCYSGQEIVARTAHRGRVKRRLHGFAAASAASADWCGEALFDGERKLGEIVSAGGTGDGRVANVLGLVPIDSAPVSVVSERGVELRRVTLPYPLPADA